MAEARLGLLVLRLMVVRVLWDERVRLHGPSRCVGRSVAMGQSRGAKHSSVAVGSHTKHHYNHSSLEALFGIVSEH